MKLNYLSVLLTCCVMLFCANLPAFTITHLLTNVSCNGGSNGSIDLTITNGIQPYTFAWSNSATTEDISGLSAGTYSVTITDATPSTQTATFTITQPAPLVINAAGNSPACYNNSTGNVTVNMVQGTGPYTWALNGPPSMTPTVTDENFNWVRQGGGTGTLDNKSRAVCADKNGNVYATGEFYNTITLGNNVFVSSGNSDIFIARYTSSGTLVWVRRVGGTGYDAGIGIACDTFGNIYVTGNFRATVTFGTYTITSYDVDDTFIAKYDANGNCLWVYHPVSTSTDLCWSIAVDNDANCYVSGYYVGTITFSPLAPMTSPSGYSIVVAKLNASGVPIWSKIASGSGFNQGTAIALDNSGNIFVTGYFSATCNFGPYNVTSTGNRDIYLAKYNNNGVEQWVRSAGSPGFDDYGLDVCTDNLGNAYITGYFRATVTFGTQTVVSAGADDMFLAKYTTTGTCIWAVRGGGSLIDHGNSVHCDQYNNPYVTGFYYSTAVFGSFTLTPGGFNELFVARYNSNGVIQLIKGVNGPTYEEGHCIFNDHNGSTYVSGMFGGSTNFGSIPMTALGTRDLFVSRFSMTAAVDTVNNLSPGTYTATVTDKNGCSASTVVTLTQPLPITVTPTTTDPACNGGTGTASLAISGGTPGYTSDWGSANPNALSAGTYPVTITDASGCDTTISVIIAEPAPIAATLNVSSPLCNADCNGSISTVPSGGTPGYTYAWSNSTTNSTASNLCAGSYSVTITDMVGCTATFTQQVTAPPLLTGVLNSTDESCANSCNGSISVNPTGGTPSYTYAWSNSSTANPATSLCAGTYSVTVTDAAGCTTSLSTSITAPTQLVATTNSTDASCFSSCNGDITVNASGGTPGYSFLWNTSATMNPINSLCAGMYSVIITDLNGCSQSVSVTITSPPELLIGSLYSVADTVCVGQCTNISSAVSGGTPGYTYSWQPTSGLNNPAIQNPSSCPAGTTTYTLSVNDSLGCAATDSLQIIVDICLGTTTPGEQGEVLIYPNPSSGVFTLDFGTRQIEPGSVCIRDAAGRTITPAFAIKDNLMELNLEEVAAGIYFVTAQTTNGGIIYRKLIKQ